MPPSGPSAAPAPAPAPETLVPLRTIRPDAPAYCYSLSITLSRVRRQNGCPTGSAYTR